jgi:hypothetical protein
MAPLTNTFNASTLQFTVNSMYGYKAGLQYFDVTGAVKKDTLSINVVHYIHNRLNLRLRYNYLNNLFRCCLPGKFSELW